MAEQEVNQGQGRAYRRGGSVCTNRVVANLPRMAGCLRAALGTDRYITYLELAPGDHSAEIADLRRKRDALMRETEY